MMKFSISGLLDFSSRRVQPCNNVQFYIAASHICHFHTMDRDCVNIWKTCLNYLNELCAFVYAKLQTNCKLHNEIVFVHNTVYWCSDSVENEQHSSFEITVNCAVIYLYFSDCICHWPSKTVEHLLLYCSYNLSILSINTNYRNGKTH